ncbi:MAG: hypothetical protein V4594_04995 [Bacteroidota bacterium]
MSGFPILDLVAGLIFIYFLLSIIASSVVELILTFFKFRAKVLETWLLRIFAEEVITVGGKKVKLGTAIMDHCSNTALSATGGSTAYIDAKNFASALLEKVSFDPNNETYIVKDISDAITSLTNSSSLSPELKRVFLMYAEEAIQDSAANVSKGISDLAAFKGKIEGWYDSSMLRIGGHMKRKYAMPFTILVSVVATIGLNADTIEIAKYLHRNPEVAGKLATQAYATGKDSLNISLQRLNNAKAVNAKDSATTKELEGAVADELANISDARAVLDQSLPLGWPAHKHKDTSWFVFVLNKVTGLAITIMALIMGAPFWFDVLNKISNLRGSGTKPPVEPPATNS